MCSPHASGSGQGQADTLGYGHTLGAQAPAAKFLTTFNAPLFDSIYFGDHMSPFHSLMAYLKDSTPRECSVAIDSLLISQAHKILVAVTGKYSTDSSISVPNCAIQFLTGFKPRATVAIKDCCRDKAYCLYQDSHQSEGCH